jgi:hypothetical protein
MGFAIADGRSCTTGLTTVAVIGDHRLVGGVFGIGADVLMHLIHRLDRRVDLSASIADLLVPFFGPLFITETVG